MCLQKNNIRKCKRNKKKKNDNLNLKLQCVDIEWCSQSTCRWETWKAEEKTEGLNCFLSLILTPHPQLLHFTTISFKKQVAQDGSILFVLWARRGCFKLAGKQMCVGVEASLWRPQLIYCLISASLYLWQVPSGLFILID